MKYFDQYMKELSLELYGKIHDKKIVYLDVKYWILLRDYNKTTDKTKREVAERLTELLNSQTCVFPISETTFWEIMKQADQSRKDTFKIVDEFSQGLTIVNGIVRVQTEFYWWLQFLHKDKNLIEPQKLIWTNIHLEIGRKFYSQKAELINETLQTELLDFTRRFSINGAFNIANTTFPAYKYKDNIDAFNENKEKYKDQNKSFDEMFLSELAGMLDEFRDSFSDVIDIDKAEKLGRELFDSEKHQTDIQVYCNIIYHSFRLKKITAELPFLKIYPSLHALMRWNKERHYKDGNDTMDVMHAATALPYCDYFFTEKELCSMIKQLKIDKLFACIVESADKSILVALDSL